MPYKSKDDNLYNAVTELQTMINSAFPLPTYINTPRAQVINKLRELLLLSTILSNITY